MDLHLSDHCHLRFLLCDQHNSGHKPFKFFNHIADYSGFIDVVKQGWRSMSHPTMRGVWQNLKGVKLEI